MPLNCVRTISRPAGRGGASAGQVGKGQRRLLYWRGEKVTVDSSYGRCRDQRMAADWLSHRLISFTLLQGMTSSSIALSQALFLRLWGGACIFPASKAPSIGASS